MISKEAQEQIQYNLFEWEHWPQMSQYPTKIKHFSNTKLRVQLKFSHLVLH